jgi:hypothetical protein
MDAPISSFPQRDVFNDTDFIAGIDLAEALPENQNKRYSRAAIKDAIRDILWGVLTLIRQTSTPTTPTTTQMRLYSRSINGQNVLAFMGPDGVEILVQPSMIRHMVSQAGPARTTTMTSLNCGLQNAATLSHPALGTGTLAESLYRTRFSTSTVAGNSSNVRMDNNIFMGSGGLPSGYIVAIRFCSGSINLVGGQKLVGLRNSNAALAAEPSASTNCIMVSKDSADTNWHLVHSNNAGPATKTAAIRSTAVNVVMDLLIYVAPGSASVSVQLDELLNDGTRSTLLAVTLVSNIPPALTTLGTQCQVRNGVVAAADNIDLVRFYVQRL